MIKQNFQFQYGDLISVIIPTYRRTEELRRAIKSAINQSYKNIEIIVIDDNAEYPEYRREVLEFIQEFPDIILIQNKRNIGGALSRNEGIKKSKGKVLAFLDDDDEWVKNKIEKQCKLLCDVNDDKLGLVICNNHQFDAKQNVFFQHMKKILATTSNWLARKEVLEEVGLFEQTPNEQDNILLLKILLAGYHVYNIPEDLVVRHFHDKDNGIGGAKLRNTIGTNRLRDLCRENYNRLDNKKQILVVEHALSSKLLDMYIYNHKVKEAKKEYRIMLKTKPFAVNTVKAFMKVYLHRIFCKVKAVK